MTGYKIAGTILLMSMLLYVDARSYSCPLAEAPICPAEDPDMAVLKPHPDDPEWYYQCSNGIAYCMPCPAGECWNDNLKVCDYPESGHCGKSSGSGDEGSVIGTGSGSGSGSRYGSSSDCPAASLPSCPALGGDSWLYFAHPTSSSHYYQCSNGIAYCMACPSGLIYNARIMACDFDRSDGGSWTGGGPESGGALDCPEATAPSCALVDISDAVLLPHPTSSSHYYECSNGIAYCMACPSGLIYNARIMACDFDRS